MTDEEYQQTQTQLLLIAHLVRDLDLAGFLRRIDQADTLGPILDPTLWIRGHDRLDDIARLARSLRQFQLVAEHILAPATPEKD